MLPLNAAAHASKAAPNKAPASSAASAGEAPAAGSTPLDDTAEPFPDTAATLAEELTRRTEALLLKLHEREQIQQARLDGMKSEFDEAQAIRAELLREMNVLRDMALEQLKKDDEVLKKWIAMI